MNIPTCNRLKLYRSYIYSLPEEYEATYQDGVYVHKESQQCKIVVQITDQMPIQLLSQIGEKTNLQYYSEMFLEIVLKGIGHKDEDQKKDTNISHSIDSDEEGKNKKKEDENIKKEENLDYWIISSHHYKKRSNLMNDMSEWTGWELHARTQFQDIFIIILRRTHIPPLLQLFIYFNYRNILRNIICSIWLRIKFQRISISQ